MKRGAPEHVSSDAERFLASPAVRELKERMDTAVKTRLRQADTNDAEACRGAVTAFQEHVAYWEKLGRMATTEQDVRERVVEVV